MHSVNHSALTSVFEKILQKLGIPKHLKACREVPDCITHPSSNKKVISLIPGKSQNSVTHNSVIFRFLYHDSLVVLTYCIDLLLSIRAIICKEKKNSWIKSSLNLKPKAKLLLIAPTYREINLVSFPETYIVTFPSVSPRNNLKWAENTTLWRF